MTQARDHWNDRVRMERVSIDSSILCGFVCIPRHTFGGNLVWLPGRVEWGSGPFSRYVESVASIAVACTFNTFIIYHVRSTCCRYILSAPAFSFFGPVETDT